LPKAARVAQREAYNVLRQSGVISPKNERARADLEVGRSDYAPAEAKPLSVDEIKTYAEMCVAMLETHGQAIDVTLAELSAEAGGLILTDDAPKVRARAERLIDSLGRKE
jgi:predicted deacylase